MLPLALATYGVAPEPLAGATTVAVVGGEPIDATSYPATGALVMGAADEALLVCTATLIAPRALLTAAHCGADDPSNPPDFTLSADVSGVPPALRLRAKRAYVNPAYDVQSQGSLHDLAIVELDAPVGSVAPESVLSSQSAPGALRSGNVVELVGYGSTSASDDALGAKNAAQAPITSVGVDEMTIGGPGEAQNCEGDSGGPSFVVDAAGARRIAGVVSRSANEATECVDGSIHTRVDAYADWIDETLATIAADDGSSAQGGGCSVARGRDAEGRFAWLAIGVFLLARVCASARRLRRRRHVGVSRANRNAAHAPRNAPHDVLLRQHLVRRASTRPP